MGTGALCAAGAGALFLRGPVQAQTPAQTARDERIIHTNKNSFRMPVKITDETRALLKEVCLYVKCGDADWVRQETANPDVQFFNYRVPRDGDYCFSVATINKDGKMTPPDVSKEAPGLRVVVDTQPPTVEFKTVTAPDGDTCVMCNLLDEHPDQQSIKITYRGPNNVEGVLEAHPTKAGLFRIPNADIWGTMVRVTASDRAGNKLRRDMRLPSLNPTPVTPPTVINDSPSVLPNQSKETVVNVDNGTGPSTTGQAGFGQQSPYAPSGSETRQSETRQSETRQPEPKKLPFHDTPMNDVQPQKYTAATQNAPAGRQILNTTRAALDYRVDKVGPSGIGKVEVWMSADNGKSWQRLREDADRRSPAEIDLPGEGVYGLRLVVTNGNGFGGVAPKPGDAPTAYIEVDTTPPFVQLRDIDPVTDGGTLQIRWTASDKNLGPSPINLYYRTQPDLPWESMAKELQNSGSYRWAFPHSRGSQFFIGIEVTDRAGNIMRAELPNAITLDMTEPQATVVGVTGMNVRPR
jgi:hypothetical protein